MQIVDNDNMNNLVKFEKDLPFCFRVFEYQSLVFMPIDINGNLYFAQYWNGEISLNFASCYNCQSDDFSDKDIKQN